jgi:hypothetical protein
MTNVDVNTRIGVLIASELTTAHHFVVRNIMTKNDIYAKKPRWITSEPFLASICPSICPYDSSSEIALLWYMCTHLTDLVVFPGRCI